MSKTRHRASTAVARGFGFFIPGEIFAATTPLERQWWWSQSGSNRRPQACKASALPTELWPQCRVLIFTDLHTDERGPSLQMVGREGVEPSTSRLSGVRSNHLSYRPPCHCRSRGRGRREPAQASLLFSRSVSRMKGHEDGGNVLWNGGEERELLLPPKSLERR